MIDFNFNNITIYGIVIIFLLLYILPKVVKISLLIGIFIFVYLFFFPKKQNKLYEVINSMKEFNKIDKKKSDKIRESINDFIIKEEYMTKLLDSRNCEKEDVKYTFDSLKTNKNTIIENFKYLFINSDYQEFNKELKSKINYVEKLLDNKIDNYHKKILKKFKVNNNNA
jgi:hypothetical protein